MRERDGEKEGKRVRERERALKWDKAAINTTNKKANIQRIEIVQAFLFWFLFCCRFFWNLSFSHPLLIISSLSLRFLLFLLFVVAVVLIVILLLFSSTYINRLVDAAADAWQWIIVWVSLLLFLSIFYLVMTMLLWFKFFYFIFALSLSLFVCLCFYCYMFCFVVRSLDDLISIHTYTYYKKQTESKKERKTEILIDRRISSQLPNKIITYHHLPNKANSSFTQQQEAYTTNNKTTTRCLSLSLSAYFCYK